MPTSPSTKGLRQFLTPEQQRDWLEGKAVPPDTDERSESLEQRFKYAARFEKLMRRPQAQEVLEILRLYGENCIPIPRRTERYYWSVSGLPSTDKTLARVNAGWMELFALQPDTSSPLVGEAGGGPAAPAADKNPLLAERPAEAVRSAPPPASKTRHAGRHAVFDAPPHKGEGIRARFILHLSDFTTDESPEPDHLDEALIDQCVDRPEDVSLFLWKGDTFGLKVRGAASIRAFLANPRALRAIRRFNLTHMNRGRNAYQASHCYSLADAMLDD
jgi:hypothetical protein